MTTSKQPKKGINWLQAYLKTFGTLFVLHLFRTREKQDLCSQKSRRWLHVRKSFVLGDRDDETKLD